MVTFTFLGNSPYTKKDKHFVKATIGKYVRCAFFSLFLLLSHAYSQDANIDQIRNSNLYTDPPFVNTATWANGNANATQAHYMEGHSIGYRSLLTGLITNNIYTYYISYETEVSGIMAIDYLTHFQRLEPHGPFGHAAETVNPKILIKGSTPYVFQNTFFSDFLIPKPTPTGSPVTDQPGKSWQKLYDDNQNQLKMTGYDGTITDVLYRRQDNLDASATKVTSSIAVTFIAKNDSVILAWGGHIASRLDWGYINPTTPRSAAGISGSPYHMRNDSIKNNTTGVNKGLGATDRQLSAAAVIPPPECPIISSQTKCLESTSFTFEIPTPETGATYTWSFGSNSVDAVFQNGTNTGNSVVIIHNGGGAFTTGGSFTLNITAVKNGITQECTGVATGTVVNVNVFVDEDNKDTIQLNKNVSQTAPLVVTAVSPGALTDYNYQWSLVSSPNGSSSSITNETSSSATFNLLSPYSSGEYLLRVVATQKVAPFCKDSATILIEVAGGVSCGVSGPSPVCAKSTNKYIYDPDKNGVEDAIPTNFAATWSLVNANGAVFTSNDLTGSSVFVQAGLCGTSYTVRISLASTSGIVNVSCDSTVSVNDTEPPVITCPGDKLIQCIKNPSDTSTAVMGIATATDNCGYKLTYSDQVITNNCVKLIKRTWTATDSCNNTATCVQNITVADTTRPAVTCTANPTAVPCDGQIPVPAVTDNCYSSQDITVYYSDVPANGAATRQAFDRTWSFMDGSGNIATCVQHITFAACSARMITSTVQEQQKVTATKAATTKTPVAPVVKDLQVQAFPNPYGNEVNFSFISPVSGQARLDVFDIMGRRIAVPYQGYIQAGIEKLVTYKVPGAKKGSLIYRLNVGNYTRTGKLLSINRTQ
jgi:hypothetical protein